MVGPSVAELRVLRLRRTWEIFMIKQVIPGSRWLYGERIVEIDGPLSSHQVRVLDLGSGRLLAISMHELQPIPIAVKESKLLEVSQAEWERARLLAQAFAPYANSTYLPGKITKAIAEQIGLSLRQILRLRTDYQSSQQTTSLVRRPGGRPLGLRLLNPQVEQLIQHVVTKYLARREPDTKASICERVRLMCKRLNLSPPDPKTVLSRIRAEEGFWLECQRQGTKAARQRFEARPGKLTVEGALALIQIDHTRVDLIVVDDDEPSRSLYAVSASPSACGMASPKANTTTIMGRTNHALCCVNCTPMPPPKVSMTPKVITRLVFHPARISRRLVQAPSDEPTASNTPPSP